MFIIADLITSKEFSLAYRNVLINEFVLQMSVVLSSSVLMRRFCDGLMSLVSCQLRVVDDCFEGHLLNYAV